MLENRTYVSPIWKHHISHVSHVRCVSLKLSLLLDNLRITYRACIYDKL
jgi:hypothetical protein